MKRNNLAHRDPNRTHHICLDCGVDKPAEEFSYQRGKRWRKWYKCTLCLAEYNKQNRSVEKTRNSYLLRTYGITLNEYNELLHKQNYKCAVCKKYESCSTTTNLSVDHDHDTNVIRGLLCRNCNTFIGFMNEDVDLIRRAIFYIEDTLTNE